MIFSEREQGREQSERIRDAEKALTESQNRESVTKESADEWMLYLTARRDNNSGSNVIERRGSMETKLNGEVQSKDLAFVAAASIDDCSNCCCI